IPFKAFSISDFLVTKYSAEPRREFFNSLIWATDKPFSPALEKVVNIEIVALSSSFLSFFKSWLFCDLLFIVFAFYKQKICATADRPETHSAQAADQCYLDAINALSTIIPEYINKCELIRQMPKYFLLFAACSAPVFEKTS